MRRNQNSRFLLRPIWSVDRLMPIQKHWMLCPGHADLFDRRTQITKIHQLNLCQTVLIICYKSSSSLNMFPTTNATDPNRCVIISPLWFVIIWHILLFFSGNVNNAKTPAPKHPVIQLPSDGCWHDKNKFAVKVTKVIIFRPQSFCLLNPTFSLVYLSSVTTFYPHEHGKQLKTVWVISTRAQTL